MPTYAAWRVDYLGSGETALDFLLLENMNAPPPTTTTAAAMPMIIIGGPSGWRFGSRIEDLTGQLVERSYTALVSRSLSIPSAVPRPCRRRPRPWVSSSGPVSVRVWEEGLDAVSSELASEAA